MAVEVRCFGEREPSRDGVTVRGYTAWERLKADKDGRYPVPNPGVTKTKEY